MSVKTKEQLTGKAGALVKLQKAGFNVPPFIVFTDLLLQVLKPNQIIAAVTSKIEGPFYAVRSSANVEDGATHSFAGIFHTELFVSKDALVDAIEKVQASTNSEQLKAYCTIHKIDFTKIEMNVVVQQMINAEVSGVAFGINPAKPFAKQNLISAVYGLGEGLVSGKLNADNYVAKKASNKKRFKTPKWVTTIADKQEQFCYNGSSLIYKKVPISISNKACLNEAQLKLIFNVLEELETIYGQAQDIEFCFANNTFYLLQSRPITTNQTYEKHTVWDNSNIVESYPSITSPFTFSFILDIYESVYKNVSSLLGVPQKQIEANREVFEEMLGHIKGRVYYQLINWHKALAMLPAYKLNASFMDKMMGTSAPLNVGFTIKAQPTKWATYWNTLKTVFRLLRLSFRLPKIKKQFSEKVNAVIEAHKKIDYSKQSDKAIWKAYQKFKTILVNEWSPPLANDLLAMIYFGLLQKICKRWLKNDYIHTEMVVGKHKVKSVQPALLIQKIIKTAALENVLEEIQLTSENETWEKCKNKQFGETGKLILQYINLYGDRSIGELKLENETYTQNPEAFISILKTYQSQNEHKTKASYKNKTLVYKIIERSFIAKKAAEMVADRENLRFDRTLAFGMVRRFLRAISTQWKQQGWLANQQDFFYLKEAEVNNYFEGVMDRADLQKIIQERKAEFAGYEKIENLPERINQYDNHYDLEIETVAYEGQLKGIPCCAGEVTGNVKILNNPNEMQSLEGAILVTTSTDPGWITIFQSASAILVERGSTLSHAAIVSREMGIPCIVGVKGLTQLLKDGDQIKMNGSTGLIEIIKA